MKMTKLTFLVVIMGLLFISAILWADNFSWSEGSINYWSESYSALNQKRVDRIALSALDNLAYGADLRPGNNSAADQPEVNLLADLEMISRRNGAIILSRKNLQTVNYLTGAAVNSLITDKSEAAELPAGRRLSLGQLIILDRLFSSGSNILDQDYTTLGDLFILDQLFGDHLIDLTITNDDARLGRLFILDLLFSPGSSILNPDQTSLGDLFILDQLFGN
jgi:hypothetical protein